MSKSNITKSFKVTNAHGPHDFPCKECGRDTKHQVVTEFVENGSQDAGNGNSVDWHVEYQVIQCLGCEDISFRRSSTNSEDYDFDEEGMTHYETCSFYPPRPMSSSSVNVNLLPLGIGGIYGETNKAIDNEQSILAAIGIRAILEAVCTDLGVNGNLKDQIEELKKRALVTAEGAQLLHTLRDLGNDAAHRVKRYSTDHLLLAIKVIDHLLEGTYLIPPEMARLFGVKEDAA